jgi:acetoin utilization deacetylase AcuC-like enzyme
MGFCAVNTVALASSRARELGAQRILIVDWDVHHGNGTQSIVEAEADTRFVSMHQAPWYPGTGAAEERGVGNLFNRPLPPGLPPAHYVEALWSAVVTATDGWGPELVLISAGYDCLAGDPLGGFTLEPADCATWVTRMRERWPSTPIVATMEGGYLPERLADGVLATARALAE